MISEEYLTAQIIANSIGIAIVALSNLGIAVLAYRTQKEVKRVGENVEVIHKATNSLNDKLVASTAKASKAEGVAEERAVSDERAREVLREGRR